jgi:hypothetical protein
LNHGWRAFLICNQIDKRTQRRKNKTKKMGKKIKQLKEILYFYFKKGGHKQN